MSKAVERYYNQSVEAEWTRLDRHPFEFAITQRHIDPFLVPGSRILDVGGGPGRYAFHYTRQGHRVTLFDLSPENIAFADQKQAELGLTLEGLIVGNATSLDPFPEGSFDAVFCMGPLYHLVDPDARRKALSECRRVVKTGGVVVVSFVTHQAQTISVIKRHPARLAEWEAALVQGLETGVNDTAFDTGFTEAYFIKPGEVRPLVEDAGLTVVKVAGVEGLACQSEEALLKLTPEQRDRWIDLSFRYSEDPSTLGANQHVVCMARKE